ncbi:MAG: 4Fe-4S binding protein [Candidatus Helarchaeota archaeon]
MAIPEEIPPKRRIFYELLIKILNLQQKEEIEVEFEDLKTLEAELFNFKNDIPQFNSNLILNIAEFLSNLQVLDKINNKTFFEEMIRRFDFFKFSKTIENNANSKLKLLFEDYYNKFGKKPVEFSPDQKAILQILEKLFNISKTLNSYLVPIQKNYKEKIFASEKKLTEILEKFVEIKKIIKYEDFLEKYRDFSRILRNKSLIYSVSQINKSFNQNKIDKNRIKSLLSQIIFPKLSEAVISFVLNMGPQTLDSLNEKTSIPKKELFHGIISLMDRKEIEIIEEKEHQPIYSVIRAKSKILDSINKALKILIRIKNRISKEFNVFENILENLNVFIKKAELIEDFDKEFSQNIEIILDLKDYLQKLNDLLPEDPLDTSEVNDRIDAMIEALDLYRLNLAFEKENKLREISSELDDRVSSLILESIDQDFERGQIISTIKKNGPSNILEISKNTGLSKNIIYSHLIQLKTDSRVKIIGLRDGYDLYDVPKVKSEEELLIEKFLSIIREIQKLEDNFGTAYSNIKYNLDTIHQIIYNYYSILNDFSKISYLNKQLDQDICKDFRVRLDDILNKLTGIKGKVKLKKAEINFDELVPILVPITEDEYAHLIKPRQLMGFGTIKCNEKRCLSCRSCQDICEESAVILKNTWNLPIIFRLSEEELKDLPETKRMLYSTIKKIAIKTPLNAINIPIGAIGYGKPEFEPLKCIACKKCIERCPNEAIEFEDIWNFPEIIKSVSKY